MTMPQFCDHDEPCGCYAEGYAAGKDEARCELRHHSDSQHPIPTCDCDNCQIFRLIAS